MLDDMPGTELATMQAAETIRRRDFAAARADAAVDRLRRGASSFAARVAILPEVVEAASHLAPTARFRHIAFVGELAFGRLDDAAERSSDLEAYEAARRTAKRLVADAPSGRIWDEWEFVYLISACAALMGRRRRALAQTPRSA